MSKPLFIPLKREFFEAFERGEKREEYRMLGPRWNGRTCTPGRPVILSLGYGSKKRLRARVESFRVCATPEALPGWAECYGAKADLAAVIVLEVERE